MNRIDEARSTRHNQDQAKANYSKCDYGPRQENEDIQGCHSQLLIVWACIAGRPDGRYMSMPVAFLVEEEVMVGKGIWP